MKINKIHEFLSLGFTIQNLDNNNNFHILKNLNIKKKNGDEKLLLQKGIAIFKNLFTNFKSYKKIFVPLSGGLDSRAILIGLRAIEYPKDKITCLTFGTPGQYDYDIGKSFSKHFGYNHKSIDLSKIFLEFNEIVNFARDFEYPISFIESYYNSFLRPSDPAELLLVGYMGDPIAGSHLNQNNNWNINLDNFKEKHLNYTEYPLKNPDFKLLENLERNPIVNSKINFYDQLDFILRQEYLVKPIVFPDLVSNIQAPFVNVDWYDFFMSVDANLRIDRFLFKKIIKSINYEFYNFNYKGNFGNPTDFNPRFLYPMRIIRKIRKYLNRKNILKYENPSDNYLNFDKQIRNGTMTNLVTHSIERLKSRNIIDWIDVDLILNEHMNGKDLHKILMRLTDLEIYFSSRKSNDSGLNF